MSIGMRIKQTRRNHKDIMHQLQPALDNGKVIYKVISPSEIKAQASRNEINTIVRSLPMTPIDIKIVLDIVETKKATFIRRK